MRTIVMVATGVAAAAVVGASPARAAGCAADAKDHSPESRSSATATAAAKPSASVRRAAATGRTSPSLPASTASSWMRTTRATRWRSPQRPAFGSSTAVSTPGRTPGCCVRRLTRPGSSLIWARSRTRCPRCACAPPRCPRAAIPGPRCPLPSPAPARGAERRAERPGIAARRDAAAPYGWLRPRLRRDRRSGRWAGAADPRRGSAGARARRSLRCGVGEGSSRAARVHVRALGSF